MNNFELAVEFYWKIYRDILSRCYPAYESTGFTERNLSVNFAKAMEKVFTYSYCWYEFPIGSKKEHLDLIIFDEENKNIYLVESKRFSYVNKKINSVANDTNRIVNLANKRDILLSLQSVTEENIVDKMNEYSFYGVILADVWRENSDKINLHETFRKYKGVDIENKEEYVKIYESLISSEIKDNVKNIKFYSHGINVNQDNKHQEALKNYKLLILTFEIFNRWSES